MKKLFRLILVVSLIACSSSAYAQKFGIINSQELISLMPELDSVQIKMAAFESDYRTMLEGIQVEFNRKVDDYQTKKPTLSDTMRQLKEKELQEIQTNYETYRLAGQQDAQKQQQSLMAPIIERAEKAIKKVSKAGGYLVVFDDSTGSTVYTDEAQVINILPLVRKELGISETAKPFGTAQTPAK